ncbi:MAG: hypothetical protein KA533_04050 [Sphingobium sp.]|nr:hypothetical protein [Sphingobium sp.]MBP6113025.1 hypothetical protein [Sphingobium sp.]MBP8670697.1 hypothetical protein [Sphingobium sp.]MBP9156835.1 hypothetical protein [Sphingobium sp.]MCC6480882.1 hypothetical protein [Sphingomonadaceae bacterium]
MNLSSRMPDPRAAYNEPRDIVADPSLSEAQKRALLSAWANEADERLRAEDEGMSAADPMATRAEADLADEVRQDPKQPKASSARPPAAESIARSVLVIATILAVAALILVTGVGLNG